MTPEQARVGVRIRTLVEWSLVAAGTEGVIDEDYGTGVMVAWDTPGQPLPENYISHSDPRLRTRNLLRDGFSKEDLKYLELDPKYAAEALDHAITKHDNMEWDIEHPNFGGTS